jgi:uncharacterized protein YxjI
MRLVLKQEFWSLGDDFVIKDEHGNECYHVDGRAFSFGDKLSIHDARGIEVASIEQRVFSWGAKYEIHRPGRAVTLVSKEHFTFFYCKFEIDGPGREDYEASGDFLDHEYEISGASGLVAKVSKQWFDWSDTYGIDLSDDLDPVLMLAIVVVIDLVCHADKNG